MSAADTKSPANGLRWSGLVLMLVAATARGLTPFTDLPHWDLDPMQMGAPMLGIGPAGSLLFDVAALLGAGLSLAGEALAGRRLLALPCVLAAFGAAGIVLHGWVLGGGTLGNQRVGAAWLSAVACGLATVHLARDAACRQLILASALAFIAALALKGAQQVFVEHPQTVEDYRRNREAMLAAQGWTPDSPMARQYERRLLQAEASGWYGLANVYASLGAAGVLLGFGLLAGWFGRARQESGSRGNPTLDASNGVGRWVLAAVLGLLFSLAALALAGSKGGVIAVLLGIGAAGTVIAIRSKFVARAAALGGWLGAAMVVVPLALVAVRGFVGERIGELSLLFRWFYAQAAAKITLAHPLGVGPDGFQRAYQLAKPPLSPEDVKSPHAIVLDYTAALGVFGLAWCGLLLWCMWRAGRAAAAPPTRVDSHAAATDRPALSSPLPRALCLIAAMATIVGAWLDHGYMTPDGAAIRVLGLALWCLVGVGALRLTAWLDGPPDRATGGTGGSTLALFGAAAVLAAHGQIDVVASWPGSAALFWLVIGTAAACGLAGDSTPVPRRASPPALLVGPALIALAGLVLLTSALPAMRWERRLHDAAAMVSGIGQFQREAASLAAAAPGPQRDEAIRSLARDLSLRLGRPVEPTPAALQSALTGAALSAIPGSIESLLAARSIYPDEWRVGREASRLALVQAQALVAVGEGSKAQAAAARAVEIAQGPAGRRVDAGALVWLALVYQARAELFAVKEDQPKAVEVLERAAKLDPYNLDIAVRLMRLGVATGDGERAARWARRALELDEQSRLDRQAHGLRESERSEAVGLAGKP